MPKNSLAEDVAAPRSNPELLKEFVEKVQELSGLTKEEIAAAMGACRLSLRKWIDGDEEPSATKAEAIHTYSSGYVPKDGWPRAKKEFDRLKAVRPFRPARAGLDR